MTGSSRNLHSYCGGTTGKTTASTACRLRSGLLRPIGPAPLSLAMTCARPGSAGRALSPNSIDWTNNPHPPRQKVRGIKHRATYILGSERAVQMDQYNSGFALLGIE